MRGDRKRRQVGPAGKPLCFAAGLMLVFAVPTGCSPPINHSGLHEQQGDIRRALKIELSDGQLPQPILALYARRGFAPLWVSENGISAAGKALLAAFAAAGAEGLDPAAYASKGAVPVIAGPDRTSRARLEVALTEAFIDYLRDRTRSPEGMVYYVDAAVPRRDADPASVLGAVANGAPLERALAGLPPPNPLYSKLRKALADHRSGTLRISDMGNGPRRAGDVERLIILNMARTRGLPAMSRGRYLIVDTAAARLLMIEDGAIYDEMRVIIGKPEEQTPDLAGELRFAVLNPYWNLPPDLARIRAARVLKAGPAVLAAERIELLSGWGDSAHPVHAAAVDWRAVAAGKQRLRMRQLPGERNMMGKIKFMLPNRLGIYLHDTPLKTAFSKSDRRLSSGCVRVEDAERLASWLFGGNVPRPGSMPEWRADLPRPVPVYILYMTALPTAGGLLLRPDIYGRDRPRSALRPRSPLSLS